MGEKLENVTNYTPLVKSTFGPTPFSILKRMPFFTGLTLGHKKWLRGGVVGSFLTVTVLLQTICGTTIKVK